MQKVPALGDIPLLGNLFRYRSNDHQKQDLMVFLHPRILRDAATRGVGVEREVQLHPHRAAADAREQRGDHAARRDMPMLPEVHDFLASPRDCDCAQPKDTQGNETSVSAAQ